MGLQKRHDLEIKQLQQTKNIISKRAWMKMYMKMNISHMLKKKKETLEKNSQTSSELTSSKSQVNHYTSYPTKIRCSIKFYNNFKEINILGPYIFFIFIICILPTESKSIAFILLFSYKLSYYSKCQEIALNNSGV